MSICAVPVRSVRQTGDGVIVAACGEGGRGGTQPASVTSSNIDSSDCFIEAPLAPGRPGRPLLLPPTCLAAAGHRARKSVEEGKSVSVRVDLGGRRILKKNKKNNTNST